MIAMINNRKGVFYLMIAVLFVAVMIFVMMAYNEYGYSDRQEAIESRIRTINDFIKDIDSDSQRVIYIAGFRSLIALEDHIAQTGQYIDDTEELFRIAFYNGTVNNTEVEVLKNSTYKDYLEKLQTISERIGVDIDINVTGITLFHDSPWSVGVVVSTDINITDTKGLGSWEFTKDYNTSVSLISIRDPVYSVSTLGRVPNVIRRTNITDYVNDTNNNTDGLMEHINNSYYIANKKAPSFLMRMRGNFSNSSYGIESLVDIAEMIYQEVDYDSSRSIVDYVLFSNITGYDDKVCNVDNMPTWFKIDINHTSEYEVNKLSSVNC